MTGAMVSADDVVLLDVLRGVLDRCGDRRWLIQPDPAWCRVVSPAGMSRKHGWKLHVSATPRSAPVVLERAAEVLVRHGVTFKFAATVDRVVELVGPNMDRSVAGKFLTAYPASDAQAADLADELHRVTAGLPGPRILSDRPVRPGSLVHYRYGVFVPDTVFTDQAVFESWMVGPDGSRVRDERTAWFAPPPWAVSPFPSPPSSAGAAMVLSGRFRVTGALRHANKGGVFEAVDTRDGSAVVVKQARAHVGAKLDGTDVRDVLRHEARMLSALSDTGVFPEFVDLFEEQGDLFLVEEQIGGATADIWAAKLARRGELTADAVKAVAAGLIRAIRRVHAAAMVLCDLKPANVIVTPSGGVRLIDAEVVAVRGQKRLRGYTVGFAAPELLAASKHHAAPPTEATAAEPVVDPAADCFSLGVTLFCLASGGLPAHWVAGRPDAPRSTAERRDLLSRIAADRPALAPFREMITGLTETDPSARWSLDQADGRLAAKHHNGFVHGRDLLPSDGLDRLLADGLRHLCDGMTPQAGYLWRAGLIGEQRYDPCDAWRGAAGPLATLTRAARVRPELLEAVAQTAAWIGERLDGVPRILPGLCFGRAGTAWALYDAAGSLGDGELAARALDLARRLPTDGHNPDVAHGLAGAGLALLELGRAEPDLLQAALKCAEAVLARPSDGRTGFAHGVAGTGMFLLAAGQVDGDERCRVAALAAGETLVAAARREGGVARWPIKLGGEDVHRAAQLQWCNGPAGIGTFLIRLGAATGDQRFADAAIQCAPQPADFWAMSVGACCGLSGAGHFLLDLAGFTGDDRFRDRAEQIAGVIYAQASTGGGRLTAGHAEAGYAYAEGTAGVLDFLVRLRHGGPRPWLPDSASPAARAVRPNELRWRR